MTDLASRPASLGVELLRHGAVFVVVGSTARWLRTCAGLPRDLDIVVEELGLPQLVSALSALGAPSSAAALGRATQSHVDTAWGPLDVFVDRLPPSVAVPFRRRSASVLVPVVAAVMA